jgi:hypothetical protein
VFWPARKVRPQILQTRTSWLVSRCCCFCVKTFSLREYTAKIGLEGRKPGGEDDSSQTLDTTPYLVPPHCELRIGAQSFAMNVLIMVAGEVSVGSRAISKAELIASTD